ncbi:MAG: saccharopine dehydrogenase NADP-binding domain-containing protein [Myxococcales bacterium]|nr:saccharopine dehydrogenase NADP-binding domain-containing protein [Myxococcales bacterium]
MKRILLLGSGKIGWAIAHLLVKSGDYEVIAGDVDIARLDSMPDGAERRQVDASNPDALAHALADVDAVVNACPYDLGVPVARAARAARVHYFDLTEDVKTTDAVAQVAQGAETLFMPQCGLAPGFISIAANDLARRFDTLYRVRMRVGALPIFPTNALKYNLTWSTAGLINEYCNPCQVLRDGELCEVLPLEGYEQFALDGVTYEAFNTSGGLGTLCKTLKGRVDNMSYKTIRYPGHQKLMKFLCEDLRLCKRRELFLDVLENAVPATEQDLVLIFVSVSGTRGGRLMQETFTRKVYHGEIGGQQLAAIQITTASSICAVLDLVRTGVLPQKGFVRQEEVPLDTFLANRFGAAYQSEGHSS